MQTAQRRTEEEEEEGERETATSRRDSCTELRINSVLARDEIRRKKTAKQKKTESGSSASRSRDSPESAQRTPVRSSFK